MNARQQSASDELAQQVWAWLDEVPDPEVPVVSVIDLGMVRNVTVDDDAIVVSVSPTYSGCPATEVIEQSIVNHLQDKGIGSVSVERSLSPAWSTDWITAKGREKLLAYGIAPPVGAASKRALLGKSVIACPRCRSEKTTLISEFGSTACKASYKCDECLEPFEYFKCI